MVAGIDTSKWQKGKVDFSKAKAEGKSFVMLRLGYDKKIDKFFLSDYAKAKKAGLLVGAYFYTTAFSVAQAEEDAERCYRWIYDNNIVLDLPLAYDMEEIKYSYTNLRDFNTDMYIAFYTVMGQYGIETMLYSSEYWLKHYFKVENISVWVANRTMVKPTAFNNLYMWQYDSGKADGSYYNGNIDKNYLCTGDVNIKIPYIRPTRILKYRNCAMMHGEDVKYIQYHLYKKGFLSSQDIDGYFGIKTYNAVKAYQKSYDLKIDGIVGQQTLAKMEG